MSRTSQRLARKRPDVQIVGDDFVPIAQIRDFGLSINFYTMNANNPGTPSQMGPWGVDKVGVIWNWGHKSPVGEVQMRKTDHQLQAPLFLGIWAKQGSKGVKYDAQNTGYGFRSEVIWDSYISSQPTSCQMKRPS